MDGSGDGGTRIVVAHLMLPDGTAASIAEGRRLLIGSSQACDVRLSGDGVAAQHCAVCASGQELLLENLAAPDSVLLNGERARRALLAHGDVITVAGDRLRIETTAGVAARLRREWRRLALRWGMGTAIALGLAAALVLTIGPRLARWVLDRGPSPAATCTLQVASEPAGASVWVDGVFRGQSPLSVAIRSDAVCRVKLTKKGHLAWERTIAVHRSQEIVEATLPFLPRGRLLVQAYPPGAVVLVDGDRRGRSPVEIDVPSGSASVRVECRGYSAFQRDVAVAAGARVSLRCVLRYEEPGSLREHVRLTPTDARGHFQLAEALFTRGEIHDALASLGTALGFVASGRDTSQWDETLRGDLTRLYRDPPIPGLDAQSTGQIQAQLDSVFAALAESYVHPAVLEACVGVHVRAGRLAVAEELCERAMTTAPDAMAPYLCLAATYRDANRVQDAEAVLVLCQAMRRPARDTCLALAVAWAQLSPSCRGARARAEAELQRALAACPSPEDRRRLSDEYRRLAPVGRDDP